ncbi:ABC transporter permease subunit [Rudaeicoccus suwonensis]|uniref:ABC-2 family transporter n=1 Tax=Rudaeicoccus suwonensis TaxID=657409 RepID=A0A561E7W5_9MICO|nr:ABC transporter permease subunit [Rudaeicoccus suwonensis]TWE11701.1 ABC-2 family transporter [Rudaeicoccus suwonensis]
MTQAATIDTTDVAPTRAGGDAKVTLGRVTAGEWVKFRSLRSTWYALIGGLAVAVALGYLFSLLRATHAGTGPHAFGVEDPIRVSMRGLMLAQLPIGVLGVLFITGEYATGMIRASLSAAPGRWNVLVGKSIVLTVITFVLGTITCLAAFLLGQAALNTHHYGVSLGATGSWRAIIGGGIYLTLVALLGLGCGFLIRSTGGAIATLFGLLLVLPLLGEALPTSWADHINQYLPMNAGTQILGTLQDPHNLAPWVGTGVFALWTAAALIGGVTLLMRRDA